MRISDKDKIGKYFQDYFVDLFSSTNPRFPSDLHNLIPPTISNEENQFLCDIPIPELIKDTFFSLKCGKSPRPDGMSPSFYKHYWSIISTKVTEITQHFFQHGTMPLGFKHTFLALIPKKEKATKVDHFRSIALCNVAYKVITKILANRLKDLLDHIVSPWQSSFILNRFMQDNVFITHECMHYIKRKKAKLGYMAIKIDMAKADDKEEWCFLLQLFKLHGFSESFMVLIRTCILSPMFSILLNGSPFGYFAVDRGLRQGDPISPALSTIFIDVFSRIILGLNFKEKSMASK